jgi:hypothetical protein
MWNKNKRTFDYYNDAYFAYSLASTLNKFTMKKDVLKALKRIADNDE